MSILTLLLLAAVSGVAAVAWRLRPRAANGWLLPTVAVGLLAAAALAAALTTAADGLLAVAHVLAVVAAVAAGGPLTELVLRLVDRSERGAAGAAATGRSVTDRGVLRGGAWIGALERTGVAVALLAGSVEAVAIVLAVKGVGRYPELREPAAAERFIVGTFVSILWAAAAAGVAILLRA